MSKESNRKFTHPLTVALVSGIILAILGFLFTTISESKENKILEKKSKLSQYELYLNELSFTSTNFYSVVENYILDIKEFSIAPTDILEERIWLDIQKVNLARAPLFASLEKIQVSDIGINNQERIEEYSKLIYRITMLCQTRRKDKIDEIRKLLDNEFSPKRRSFLSDVQEKINQLRNK